jgi:predicted deacylase
MFQLSENLRTVIDQDGAVLLDVVRGKIVRCNRTGAVILELLSRNCDRDQITAEFGRLYELSPAAAQADVAAFLRTLEEQGIVSSTVAERGEE